MSPDADPIALFDRWYAEADAAEDAANACSLATATASGVPSSRMVLVKEWDARGFVVYTNLGSRKAHDLQANPHAALLWHWKSLKRQVRIEGAVEPVSDEQADAYFARRPRKSRVGAWASKQSQPLNGMGELEGRVAAALAKYPIGPVPRPEFWSGYRVQPKRIEFWEDRAFRLHMRWQYSADGDGWAIQELYP